jgi:uncharacterized protein with HEPN domain
MRRKQLLYVNDIIKAIESILAFTDGISIDEFINDDKTLSAVVRKLEIIGEAVKNLSIDIVKGNPEVPWSDIARMRDKLIHGYFGIDAEIIWKVAREDMPNVLGQIIKIAETIQD